MKYELNLPFNTSFNYIVIITNVSKLVERYETNDLKPIDDSRYDSGTYNIILIHDGLTANNIILERLYYNDFMTLINNFNETVELGYSYIIIRKSDSPDREQEEPYSISFVDFIHLFDELSDELNIKLDKFVHSKMYVNDTDAIVIASFDN